MPIDARIPLMGQPVQLRDFNIAEPLQAAASLQQAQNQARLSDLQYAEAQRAIAEEQSLRQAYAANMQQDPVTGQPTLNQAGFLSAYGRQNPVKAMSMGAQMEKNRLEAGKAKASMSKEEAETALSQLKMINSHAFAVLEAYRRGADPLPVWQNALATLARAGVPVDHLPATPTPELAQQYFDSSGTEVSRLQHAKQMQDAEQFQQQDETTRRGDTLQAETALSGQASAAETARAGHAVTREGHQLTAGTARLAREQAERLTMDQPRREADAYIRTAPYRADVARQTQAEGLTNVAQKSYDAATAKNQAELENAPLGEAMAERVSYLNGIITFTNQLDALKKPGFTGPIESYRGAIRQFTGDITKDEVTFRAVLMDAQDLLSRSRSGAAITESEMVRLEKLLPTVKDQPNVFAAKLERFGKAVETIRDEKVKLATTPRGRLLETMPRVGGQPRPQAAAPAAPAGKAMSRAQAEQIAQLKGVPVQQVIDTATKAGYQVR